MKLSGLWCLFSLRPQRAVNVPREAPRWFAARWTLGLTERMSAKSSGEGPLVCEPPPAGADAEAEAASRPSGRSWTASGPRPIR